MKLIAPSILSADFSRLGEEVQSIDAAGADWIHVDVMDGNFVPNITIGAPVVKAIRPHTQKILDVHLMVENPQKHIKSFAQAGADIITVHAEACGEGLVSALEEIRSYGKKAGVSLKPSTPAEIIGPIFDRVDVVLVMTVEPGFGGQKFLHEELEKIHKIRGWIDSYGHDILLEVDGGINIETIAEASRAGADVFVAGTAVFQNKIYMSNINKLRNEAVKAV